MIKILFPLLNTCLTKIITREGACLNVARALENMDLEFFKMKILKNVRGISINVLVLEHL
jgi:hypothetical protein